MLPFANSPSAAFCQATAYLGTLRTFDAQAECALGQLAREVVTRRFTTFAKPSAYRKSDEYRSDGRYLGYKRGNTYRSVHHMLREKFFCDIAHDMRLAHSTVALLTPDETSHHVDATISLLPSADVIVLNSLFPAAPWAPPRRGIETPKVARFLQQQSHLIPPFVALSVFDLWIANRDRHIENLAISPPNAEGRHDLFYGYDLIPIHELELKKSRIDTPIDQQAVLHLLPPASMGSAVKATVEAIETYPSSRLKQLAARLQPYEDREESWSLAQTVDCLESRRPNLRRALPEYFPSRALDGLKI